MFWFMTAYAYPTYTKQIPDWKRYPELMWLNRFDWIPFVAFRRSTLCMRRYCGGCRMVWSNRFTMASMGFILPTIALYHATFSVILLLMSGDLAGQHKGSKQE